MNASESKLHKFMRRLTTRLVNPILRSEPPIQCVIFPEYPTREQRLEYALLGLLAAIRTKKGLAAAVRVCRKVLKSRGISIEPDSV